MYSLSHLRRALENPRWFIRKANKIYSHGIKSNSYNREGTDIFSEDWDNLIILDACRYDTFEKINSLDGTLEKRVSRGSTSPEFIRGNFARKKLYDVVYVSTNPHYQYLKDDIRSDLHEYICLHDEKHRDAGDGLTTHPETVNKKAIEANEKYPNKKLIVHYFQPHQPYLGEYGSSRFEPDRGLPHIVKNQNPDLGELQKAYEENLELVIRKVEKLLENLQGKTVITSDHGELFDDRMKPIPVKDYGHHEGVYVDELVEVPWFIVKSGDRKEIVSEKSVSNDKNNNKQSVKDHLEDLGYLE